MLSEHVYVLMLRIWYGEFGRVGPGEASGRGVRGVVAAAQQEEAVIVVECQGHLCRMMVSMTLWSHLPLLTEPPPINSHAMQVNNTLFFFFRSSGLVVSVIIHSLHFQILILRGPCWFWLFCYGQYWAHCNWTRTRWFSSRGPEPTRGH